MNLSYTCIVFLKGTKCRKKEGSIFTKNKRKKEQQSPMIFHCQLSRACTLFYFLTYNQLKKGDKR